MLSRVFIALSISEQSRLLFGDLSAQMSYQDKSHAVRWVDEDNYHLTLAFLGELTSPQVDSLASALESVLSVASLPKESSQLAFTHISPFPGAKPKIIAAMLEKTEGLVTLYELVQKAVRIAGLSVEKRKFIPHVTLGRFRHSRNSFAGFLPSITPYCEQFEQLCIYQSTLLPSGAEYQPLYIFPFIGAAYEL